MNCDDMFKMSNIPFKVQTVLIVCQHMKMLLLRLACYVFNDMQYKQRSEFMSHFKLY